MMYEEEVVTTVIFWGKLGVSSENQTKFNIILVMLLNIKFYFMKQFVLISCCGFEKKHGLHQFLRPR